VKGLDNMWDQIISQDPTGLLPALLFILVLGAVWLVIRFIFKLAMRVFMIGCVAIVLLGAFMVVFGSFAR
jgi:hypothetical protein